MNPAITSPAVRTASACVSCPVGVPHELHDADTVPLAVRMAVRVTTQRPLHEYLPFPGQSDRYPEL